MPLVQTRGAASAQGFGEFAQASAANWIDDVFSTYLYTGNSSTQTITNGIDLAGKGGMVWIKNRTSTANNVVTDTVRGQNILYTNLTNAQDSFATGITSFNTNGFSLGDGNATALVNLASNNYCSWTFREQAKFFDVTTATQTTGNTGWLTFNHSLGSTPGMILIKVTSTADNWFVYHRSTSTSTLILNLTNAASATVVCQNVTSTSFEFNLANYGSGNGATYVAYLFAHDAGGFGTSGTDNVISCGSYTGTGTDPGPTINLGYEPQYLLVKRASGGTGGWVLLDSMRGWTVGGQVAQLRAQNANAESVTSEVLWPASTGFQLRTTGTEFNETGNTYIYMAIRRPMKPPTSGTQVFAPVAFTGNNTANTPGQFITAGFTVDLAMQGFRNQPFGTAQTADRLRGFTGAGPCPRLLTYNTNAEANSFDLFGGDSNVGIRNYGHDPSYTMVNWLFRRAPGFFDEVCYNGVVSPFIATNNHNLTVAPEMMICKVRNLADSWFVYHQALGASSSLTLNSTSAAVSSSNFGNTAPTATQFTTAVGGSAQTLVAYLFATLAGVSKVGTYTGTGATQTINCGFTGGARFVLIKRTDSTGNWWVWDTARGMVTSTDPRLAFNSTAAELNNDWVLTTSTGFQIVTTDATVNASGGTYIFLAIA